MTFADRAFALLAFVVVLFALLGVGAWWADRQLERHRKRLPAPRRQAVVKHRLYW